jgi:RNA polymerase sigma-70 factor (ECF subfamily)
MSHPIRTDPDRELVLACQGNPQVGFQGAFRSLYEQYKDRVYNVCYRITGNPSDALDASQETFGVVFRKIRDFRFESKFSSWVYRIAVNASIDLKRRGDVRGLGSEASASAAPNDLAAELMEDEGEAPMAVASRHELEAEIERAIARLSPKMRAIIVLRYVEELSYEEISETLTISIGTVKSRLARAHAALDRELTPILDRHLLR